MKDVYKVLTLRASSIGDCLMGKFFLENVRVQFPGARYGIMVGTRIPMIRDLLAAYPWIEIVAANRADPPSLLSLWRSWRHADIVLTQYAGKPGGRFALSSKFAARAIARSGSLEGFSDASAWNTCLYDIVVPQENDVAPAELERRALRARGLAVPLPFPSFLHLSREGIVERFSLVPQRYAIVHLFASGMNRKLRPENCRELLRLLIERLPGMRLVLTGGVEDRAAAHAALAGLAGVSVAGETTLQETAHLISQSALVVSVDTGIAHIAAGMRVPLVVLGICTAGTCTAGNWWSRGQYDGAPVSFLTRPECCPDGHVYETYPRCLNGIDLEKAAKEAGAIANLAR